MGGAVPRVPRRMQEWGLPRCARGCRRRRIIAMTTKPTLNLAARAGRWSAQHRRKAILGWLAFVIAAIAIGGAIGTNTLKVHELGTGESGRADLVLHDAGLTDAVSESVLVTAPAGATVK